jgi:hypothetical protein
MDMYSISLGKNNYPAMHNLQNNIHKKLERISIIMQKNSQFLDQYSIYYEFVKLKKKIKKSMWSNVHGMEGNWKIWQGIRIIPFAGNRTERQNSNLERAKAAKRSVSLNAGQ